MNNGLKLSMSEQQQRAFWSKVDIKKSTKECWEWKGARKPKGYGNVQINKTFLTAHRVAFALANNDIPDGFLVCHICDNPSCCNPCHLMLGTQKSNAADMLIKGRQRAPETAARGEDNGMSKLKSSDVVEIRKLYANKTHNQYQLAAMYNTTQPNIGAIVRREAWKHI